MFLDKDEILDLIGKPLIVTIEYYSPNLIGRYST